MRGNIDHFIVAVDVFVVVVVCKSLWLILQVTENGNTFIKNKEQGAKAEKLGCTGVSGRRQMSDLKTSALPLI